MIDRFKNSLLAFIGGTLLTLMIHYNSLLAKYTTPIFASWVAHGLGGAVALVLVVLSFQVFRRGSGIEMEYHQVKLPLWFYLGGIPGAFTVVLAAITVNGSLSLSGSIALMLVGQIIFGMVSDHFGLLCTPKRRLIGNDLLAIFFVLTGSAMIIFGGGSR
ncbi:MAG: DMT family transporter [Brasilonema angustatum HA4187-MV1]|jgi:transporter family-2 protein|nr:DMT family transporter [Brasilonema angustatum HA4187-MV1]